MPEENQVVLKLGQNNQLDFSLFFRKNQPFRSAVIRFPWVYVLSRSSPLTGTARLFVFRLDSVAQEQEDSADDDTVPQELSPLRVIEDVGDGQNLMRWDDFLVCTRRGDLEVYSLADPEEPKRIGRCRPDSKKSYLTNKVVRDGNRAFAIGNRILLRYDLGNPAKPKYLGEKAVKYECFAGCVARGHLYIGGFREGDSANSSGIAVFDVGNPFDLKELHFLPLSTVPYHLFPLPDNQLLASLDADSSVHTLSPNNMTVHGNSAFVDLAKPTQPVLAKEMKGSGGRTSTVLSAKHGDYFVCEGAVFSLHDHQLGEIYSFSSPGSSDDGFPYHGDSNGSYAVLPADNAAIVLRITK